MIAGKLGITPFAGKASDEPPPRKTSLVSEAVFNYSNYNGRYVIGRETLEFETKWSKASNVSIHVYNDPPSINAIALGPLEWTDISQVVNAATFGIILPALELHVSDKLCCFETNMDLTPLCACWRSRTTPGETNTMSYVSNMQYRLMDRTISLNSPLRCNFLKLNL